MSSSFDLLGVPEQPTLPIQFSQFVNVFEDNGASGVPNAAADPMSAVTYMVNKANLITQSAQQRPMVRLADKNLNIMAELVGELSCDTEELMSDTGTAHLIATYDNWLVDWLINQTRVDEDMHLIIDPIPTQRTWRTRWGGKVHQINVKRNADGTSTIDLIALSHREHAKKLLVAAMPFLMPEVQFPRMWVLPGPIRTILFITFAVNLARLFLPGLSTITNIVNPASWINPLNASGILNIDPLAWPIQVAFVNPVLDQSRWTAIGAAWTSWHDATVDMLKDCGCILRAYTWLDEDTDSPHTELFDIINGVGGIALDLLALFGLGSPDALVNIETQAADALTMPKRNCVVFSIEDMSGQTGPTGTAVDGLLNLIGVTLDDLFTTTLVNADTGQTLDGEPVVDVINPVTPFFESILGVAPAPPKVIWRESQYDRVVSKQHTLYKAPVRTLMTGGRSPTIVNEGLKFGIRWALSQLQLVLTSGVFGEVGPAPIGAGLDNLYQDQLANVFFAYERVTDPTRAVWTGDTAYQEHFERGQQVAYTLAGILTLREADWNTRAYYGFQAQVISGFPWVLDVDIRLGERGGWEQDGVIYVDQVTAIRRSWDRQSPVLCTLSVGDDKDRQDPIARSMRAINAMYGLLGAFLGEGTFFG